MCGVYSACTSASLEPSYVLRAIGADEDLAHSSIRLAVYYVIVSVYIVALVTLQCCERLANGWIGIGMLFDTEVDL